ncbi:MAG: metallophosphoesterase family protein, partial [Chloroflexota bacterium]
MATKIGLISDVHADIDGLRSALRLFMTHQVNRVLCAGDLVEKGRHGDAVVALMQRFDIPCVMGNHDEFAIGNNDWLRQHADPNHPNMKGRILSEETLDYLSKLPRKLHLTIGSYDMLLVHGTPRSNMEYLMSTAPPAKYETIAVEA